MAIGSVEELIDYKEQTIAIAKKYGGGGSHVPIIQKERLQVCSDGDIRTDANGYLTNALPVCSFAWDIIQVTHTGGMPVMGTTVMIATELGILNGSQTVRIKLLDANGDPIKNSTGISDMGAISALFLAFTP